MSGHSIMFVASNDTHVRTFAPVVERITSASLSTAVVSLDQFYGQGASRTAASLGIACIELEHGGSIPAERFYARSPFVVWLDVLAARREVSSVLKRLDPRTIVVGNDRGLIEKLILYQGRRRGARTVLVQDGRLGPRPHRADLVERARGLAKRALSAALRAIGAPYLAASEYGSGGTDVICASGDAGAQILSERKRPWSKVLITGQPRYDSLPRPAEALAWDVVYFTTPFAEANLGTEHQERQTELLRRLESWAAETNRRFAVKPHPRDSIDVYADMLGTERVLEGPPSQVLAQARVVLLGISTVVEEAALIGCPVVVVGEVVHGSAFDASLPPRDVYPRGDSVEELFALVDELTNSDVRDNLLSPQRAAVSREVLYSRDVAAAANVAEVVLR